MTPVPSIDSLVEEALPRLHAEDCPKCGRPGPIDVYEAFWCRSMIPVTTTGKSSLIGCPRCGRAIQRWNLLQTVLLGWWALHGLVLTPVQLGRTMHAMLTAPNPSVPSEKLRAHVRVTMTAVRRESMLPRCRTCNEPYDLEDYREDAERILCAKCNAELPR